MYLADRILTGLLGQGVQNAPRPAHAGELRNKRPILARQQIKRPWITIKVPSAVDSSLLPHQEIRTDQFLAVPPARTPSSLSVRLRLGPLTMVGPEQNPHGRGANVLHPASYCNPLVSVTVLSFSPA